MTRPWLIPRRTKLTGRTCGCPWSGRGQSLATAHPVPMYCAAATAGSWLTGDYDAAAASLQTETANTSARALYAAVGFQPVDGLELLSLALVPEMTQ